MTELQRYPADEVVVDHADAIITRRQAMRRLAPLGVGATAASSWLAGGRGRGAPAAGADRRGSRAWAPPPTTDIAFQGPRLRLMGAWGASREAPRRRARHPREPRADRPHPLGRRTVRRERVLGAGDRPALGGGGTRSRRRSPGCRRHASTAT